MIAFLLMHGLETVIAKNNKGKGKAGPLDAIVLSSDDDYMPVRKLPPAKRRREILPASSLGSDAMPITVDSDEDVKPVFNASPSFKRQKQTTLNKYRSAVKPRDSDGDIVEAITETTAPRFEALGTPQQDVKPNQAALQQQPVQEPRFPGHFGPPDIKHDVARDIRPPTMPQPDLPPTWDGSREWTRDVEVAHS